MRALAMSILLGLMILSIGTPADELLGDPTAGRKLAEDVCAACHVIAAGQASTTEIEARAFPDLANMPRVTALSLRVFLQSPQERMPDLHLSRDETDNVIAYILSLEE